MASDVDIFQAIAALYIFERGVCVDTYGCPRRNVRPLSAQARACETERRTPAGFLLAYRLIAEDTIETRFARFSSGRSQRSNMCATDPRSPGSG